MVNKKFIYQSFAMVACSLSAFLIGSSLSLVGTEAQNVDVGTTASSPTAPAFVFTKDLSLGQTNDDIYWLQVVLNRDPATQVAKTGPGSPGLESKYYGSLTKDAVKRFLLKQFGRRSDGGIVQNFVRTKLNEILSGMVIDLGNRQTDDIYGTNARGEAQVNDFLTKINSVLRVWSVSPYQVQYQGDITINGQGFEPYNTVTIGSYSYTNIPSATGQTITMPSTLPGTTTVFLAPGTYSVNVANSKGSSGNNYVVSFIISLNPVLAPQIYSASPTAVLPTDTITLTGANFSTTSVNTVQSVYGVIGSVISSDGIHLTFPISPLLVSLMSVESIKTLPKGTKIPIPIFVITSGGVSLTPVSVDLIL